MTATLPPATEAPDEAELEATPPPASAPDPEPDAASTTRGVLFVCVAALLAGGAAGWMVAGVFETSVARAYAMIGAVVGAGMVAVSYRLGRPSAVQYATAPIAAVLGALLVLPDLGDGSASLPSLVQSALFSGGLGQPPVPFDPGWRFLLVVLVTMVTSGAASLALAMNRPNLAVVVPVPIVIGGSLLQPGDAEVVSTVGAAVMVIGALAVAYGVELASSGATSGRFEVQRLLRGLAALVALAVGLVVLANTASFLLPEPSETQVIPPQRPPAAPPQADRELFTVEIDTKVPFRLGVLDVYDDNAWKTPPFDVARFVPVDGEVPDATGLDGDEITATFTIADLPGRVVPTIAVPHTITGDGEITIDPRTDSLRLGELAREGFTYTVTASAPATAEQLSAAGPPPPEFAEFLEMPPPPPGVQSLLADAPDTNLFTRLQFVRTAYYEEVIAKGAGDPVDVPPERVDEILGGSPASPFEITAAEAMLARWTGVPSRIGYGFFDGDDLPAGVDGFSVRPVNGSAWLEVYFEGQGWVPIVGKPPRAQSSFTDAQQNEDDSVRPTDELALITYVPVRLQSLTLLFEVVRFYLLQIIPLLLLVVALLVFYPIGNKRLRTWRRSRWARQHGPAGAIAAAYGEFRDTAWDLNIGQPSDTPLEFVARLAHDPEHAELAWLVTRALWGDLSRDLHEADAAEAVEMSRSVRRRMVGAQTVVSRALGLAARSSLREPWSDDLPNAWWELRLGARVRRRLAPVGRALARVGRLLDPRRLRRFVPGLSSPTMLLVLALFLGGCAEALDLTAPADPSVLPSPAVPDAIGDITFQREPTAEVPFEEAGEAALVTAGEVYSVRVDGAIEASLQIAAFRPGLQPREEEVRAGILQSLGGGRFEPIRVGDDRIQVLESIEQRLLLWFSPDGRYYELMVARRSFDDAERLFAAILATQRGETVEDLDGIIDTVVPDPRRGFPA